MRILLPPEIQGQISKHLISAGESETGGILMGQHVGVNEFRVLDITCQNGGGSFAYFVRSIQDLLLPLRLFFTKTGNNYTQFNYIGEWHSHPSFDLRPSHTDCESMQCLVEDPDVGATFAVLLLVKLSFDSKLETEAILFLPAHQPMFVETVLENTLARHAETREKK